MDAVSLLNKHINIGTLLNHYRFDKVKDEGNLIRCACKIHGGDHPTAFVANHENNLWFCHTGGCGGGDAYTLVQKMEDCDFHTAVQRVAHILGIDIGNLHIMERKAAHINELAKWIKVMKAKKKVDLPEYKLTCEVKRVTKFRQFSKETIDHFGLIFIPEIDCLRSDGTTYQLTNRLGIPIHNEHGVQVGVSLRRTKPNDIPKWSHQPRNIKTAELLYNYDLVRNESVIAVVEGIFDTWAYHEINVPSVCTYGAHLSDEQYKMLLRTGADIVLSYDGDHAGREVTKKAIKMLKNKANLYVVQFNDGEDPESIERSLLYGRYREKVKV